MSELTSAILERLNNLVVVIDREGKVRYVSPSVEKALGFTKKQLLGEGWWNNTRKDANDRLAVKSEILEIFTRQQSGSIVNEMLERKHCTALGQDKWVLWNLSEGPDNTLISIGYDITERKLAELELANKHEELSNKNNELFDSLQYAQKIQQAMLPDPEVLKKLFSDAFVLYKPKDVVSGDFYWFYETGNEVFVAGVDCTGHGVPGALMTMIANSLLKEVITKRGLRDPAEILYALDEELQVSLLNNSQQSLLNDGMDIALAKINLQSNTLEFTGAFRPLWLVRDNEIIELKGARSPIGFFYDVEKYFETSTLQLQSGDAVYLFSDGYADQFGGTDDITKGKKFNKKRFRELLLSVQDMAMDEQESFLEYAFANWKQQIDQLDDICIIGLKV